MKSPYVNKVQLPLFKIIGHILEHDHTLTPFMNQIIITKSRPLSPKFPSDLIIKAASGDTHVPRGLIPSDGIGCDQKAWRWIWNTVRGTQHDIGSKEVNFYNK